MSTLEGTTMHPRCRHIGACWDLLEWFQLFGTSQNSNSNVKKKQVKTQFRIFFSQIFMIPCCSILEDLSIDVSIANVGLILTKLRWFQHFSTSQNSNFELFWKKKIKFLHLASCSTCEDLSIDVSITNVGLILTKLWWFLFSGYGQMDRQTDRQTDTVLESSHGNMSAHKKFQLKTKNLWLAVDPYMPPRRSGMHKYPKAIWSNMNPPPLPIMLSLTKIQNNRSFFVPMH